MLPDKYSTPTTHITLLAGVRGGEEKAWARFFLRYAPVVLRWCAQRGLQASDSEDVLQTLMKDAPRKLATYKREGEDGTVRKFGPWLRAVVGHLVIDHQRYRALRPGDFGPGGDDRMSAFGALTTQDVEDIADVITSQHSGDINRVVEAVKDRLRNKNTWDIYRAKELEGQPVDQVAKAQGITVGAIYVSVNRVNRMLVEEYQKLFPEPTDSKPERSHDLPE